MEVWRPGFRSRAMPYIKDDLRECYEILFTNLDGLRRLVARKRPEREFISLEGVRQRMREKFNAHVDDPDIHRGTWLDNYSFVYFMKKTNEVIEELYECLNR